MIKIHSVVLTAALVLSGASALFSSDLDSFYIRKKGTSISHWHGGPFFEYRRALPEGYSLGDAKSHEDKLLTFWSFRPFYSRVRDIGTGNCTYDFIWPLGTYRTHAENSWWRAIIAYGDDRGSDPSWSANVFPFWFSGADRTGKDYWGLFPIYGKHPHLLLMDDWSYVFWPIWQTFMVKGVRSKALLWPLVTWKENPRQGIGVWPFCGTAILRESQHWYAVWPIVNGARYYEDRDTSGEGFSLMVWPFYGLVDRKKEKQNMFLPPFFSYTKTDSAERWRLPWPFVEVLNSSVRNRVSVFPFYERVEGYSYRKENNSNPEEKTWRILWYLLEGSVLETKTSKFERFSFFPFWTSEATWSKDIKTGEMKKTSAYKRLWPFWSRREKDSLGREQILELNPIRHSEGVERNWSSFWTFWECEDMIDGRVRHSLFWSLFDWYSNEKD